MSAATLDRMAQCDLTRRQSTNSGIPEPSVHHPALAELDPSTSFLYKPRTITFGALGLCLLLYFSRTFNPPSEPEDPLAAADKVYHNAHAGVWAVVLSFLCYSTLQGPVTCMVRPHPAVWRFIHGVLVAYLLLCVYMLFQDVGSARQFLRHMFPELGIELNERAYGDDCRLWIPEKKAINWETIKATVFDEFVVAHTIGWWCKALILRNYTLLWTLSIGFELMELTFQHMLPNFNECWWDSWILDVALCNAIGIYTGMQTVKWARAQEYNWAGLSQQATLSQKAKRTLMQFTPYSWDEFDWRVFSTPTRCLQSLGLLMVFLIMEVNAFFLKFILWIPPLNPLNTIRLGILFLAALPTAKEYYAFIDDQSGNRKLGFFAWLYVSLAVVEMAVVVKFGHGMFPAPWPAHVLWFWGSVAAVFTAIMAVWSLRLHGSRQKAKAL